METSQAVDYHALTNAASFGDTTLAMAVARRTDLDRGLVQMLAARAESEVLLALAENISAKIPTHDFSSRSFGERATIHPSLAKPFSPALVM